jgi:hypothetical protein
MTEKYLVGIIRVPPSAFTFDAAHGRQEHGAITERLIRVFRRSACRQDDQDNYITGCVDESTYKEILSTLHRSPEALRRTVWEGNPPRIALNNRIVCVDGRQRIAAARRLYGSRFWWTVKLFHVPEGK